ncbi:MAG: hypothetical protein KF852_12355 [Saprospiraceae bacterium]|nr:hypothetical protein [Saprospiraceae bacterium]
MKNDFDSPGNLDQIITGLSNQPNSTSTNASPSSEVEITLINGGGYVAKFQGNYTVEGQAKSYESGDVLLGWKHKLPIPPNAKNVQIRAWSSWLGWKDAYTDTDANATNRCVKLFGVAWDPKANNQCE